MSGLCFRLRLSIAALGAAVALAPFTAHAKEGFPRDINNDLRLGYDPPCRLCHIQGTTGAGSVAEPFGVSMLAHGMTGSASSLPGALMALRADNTDSDGDGRFDIMELIAGTDPNTPADVRLVSQDPRYGCTIAPANGSRGNEALMNVVLAVAGAFLVRAARSRRNRGAFNGHRTPGSPRPRLLPRRSWLSLSRVLRPHSRPAPPAADVVRASGHTCRRPSTGANGRSTPIRRHD